MANPTETGYRHPFPNYQLGDLTQAMDYNNAGQPILRVGVNYGTSVTGPGNTNAQVDGFGRMRVSDVVTLAMTAASNNADTLAQLGWQEIT